LKYRALLPVYAIYDPESKEVLLITRSVPIREGKMLEEKYELFDAEVYRFFPGRALVRYTVQFLSKEYLEHTRPPASEEEKILVGKAFRRYMELHENAILYPVYLRRYAAIS